MMEVRRQRDDIIKALKEKTINNSISSKKTFTNEGKIKTFLDKQELGKFITSYLSIYELPKEVLWAKSKSLRVSGDPRWQRKHCACVLP